MLCSGVWCVESHRNADWPLVPLLCPGIEPALPAALACRQPVQVVRRMQPAAAVRLRTVALCLWHHGLPCELAATLVAFCE